MPVNSLEPTDQRFVSEIASYIRETRVLLNQIEGMLGSDIIHADHIDSAGIVYNATTVTNVTTATNVENGTNITTAENVEQASVVTNLTGDITNVTSVGLQTGNITNAANVEDADSITTAESVTGTITSVTTVEYATGSTITHADVVNEFGGVTVSAADINTTVTNLVGVTASAAEINAVCDGNTAKNNHTHQLADGADDVTATFTELNLLSGITSILDEDDMVSDSDTSLATQQSIKAYTDAEVGGAADAIDAVSSWILKRSRFTYNGGAVPYTIKVGPGLYSVKDKIAKWVSELTTPAIGTPAASTWYYLYLNYTAITSWTNITATELIWSTTAPSYSNSLAGWYNGDDLCIFAVRTDSIPENIEYFMHYGSKVSLSRSLNFYNADTIGSSWVLTSAIDGPGFCRQFGIMANMVGDTNSSGFYWRIPGYSLGFLIGNVNNGVYNATYLDVFTNDAIKIEVRDALAGGSGTLQLNFVGWYFPVGM